VDYIGAGADDKEIERGPALFGNMNFQVRRAGTLRADGSCQGQSACAFQLTRRTACDSVSTTTRFAHGHTMVQARYIIARIKLRGTNLLIRLGSLRLARHDDKRSDGQDTGDKLLQGTFPSTIEVGQFPNADTSRSVHWVGGWLARLNAASRIRSCRCELLI